VAGPYASAGPYEDDAGERYDVRLERVPGGVRLAEWSAGQIRRRAPVLEAAGLAALLAQASEREILPPPDAEALLSAVRVEPSGEPAAYGASRGRAGVMQEELRVERLDEERLRIGRWILRPGAPWELQEAPVMLPADRYAEAIRGAAAAGLLVS
jgi:hypothetical protein